MAYSAGGFNSKVNRCASAAGCRSAGKWALVLVAAVSMAQVAWGQCEYDVEIITPPGCGVGGGVSGMEGRAINDAAVVAGYRSVCFGPEDVFVWDADAKTYTILPRPPEIRAAIPTDISNVGGPQGLGTIVGECRTDNTTKAFLHNGKGFTVLGVLPGATTSVAEAITDDGTVFGYSLNVVTAEVESIFRWRDGVMVPLSLPGNPPAQAYDANEHGDCVGALSLGSPAIRLPFLLTAKGEYVELPLPTGATDAEATAVNNNRDVAGLAWGFPANPVRRHAVVWRNGIPHVLQPPADYDGGRAADTNAGGVVIGQALNVDGGRACLWYFGKPHFLTSLIDEPEGVATPFAINDDGIITGEAVRSNTGVAYRMIPRKRITGDTDCDKVIGIADLLHVIGNWGIPGGPADVNFDRIVGVPDLIEVITRWGPVPPR